MVWNVGCCQPHCSSFACLGANKPICIITHVYEIYFMRKTLQYLIFIVAFLGLGIIVAFFVGRIFFNLSLSGFLLFILFNATDYIAYIIIGFTFFILNITAFYIYNILKNKILNRKSL